MSWLILAVAAPIWAGSFDLVRSTVEIPERGSVASLILRTPRFDCELIPPADSRCRVVAEDRTVFLQPAGSSDYLRMRWPEPGTVPTKPEDLKAWVEEQFAPALVSDKWVCYAAGSEGHGFDLVDEVSAGGPRFWRVAVVRTAAGPLEISLCSRTRLERRHVLWTQFLNSIAVKLHTGRSADS